MHVLRRDKKEEEDGKYIYGKKYLIFNVYHGMKSFCAS